MFDNVYAGKTVLVTGNTGFKGSWLATWLFSLGASVFGFSNSVPKGTTMYSVFGSRALKGCIEGDVRDFNRLHAYILEVKPDFIFHLAAQPLVGISYQDPIETFMTNSIGTVNVLESMRRTTRDMIGVFITSDKVYENRDEEYSFREQDRLGGYDPYSASKAMAELALRSYFLSFLKKLSPSVRMGIGRAGNVIGGGDWSDGRLIPDCVRAWRKGVSVEIRNPESTRPWQFVLEPLAGYLRLGQCLAHSADINGEAYNFGPDLAQDPPVRVCDLLNEFGQHWQDAEWSVSAISPAHEAMLLSLDSSKARRDLQWAPTLTVSEMVDFTAEWYLASGHQTDKKLELLSLEHIERFAEKARNKQQVWAE